VPILWSPPSADTGAVRVAPPHPSNLHQAFRLGQLAAQCSKWLGSCPGSTLAEAQDVVGRPVSSEELLGVEALVMKLDQKSSVVNRLSGLLNFVNVVMFFSTLGILATVGPFLGVVLGPFLRKYVLGLLRVVSGALVRILTPPIEFCTKTVPPLLHRWGALEVGGYLLCFLLVATAASYPREHAGMGCMLGVAGGLATIPLLVYSASLHGAMPDLRADPSGKYEHFMCTINGMAAIAFMPIAYSFQSSLAGFLAVLCLYQALGFTAFSTFFGYAVGFNGRDALVRCAAASKLLLLLYAALAATGRTSGGIVAPFALGLQIMGSIAYFLALLIKSNRWCCGDERGYVRANALMGLSIVCYAFFGNVWSAPALSNTAVTFLVLWLMEVQVDLLRSATVSVFIGCCASAWACHYLSTHPAFLLSILEPRGLFV